MLDFLLHTFGVCPDGLSHPSLLTTLFAAGAFLAPAFHWSGCRCKRCLAVLRRRLGLE